MHNFRTFQIFVSPVLFINFLNMCSFTVYLFTFFHSNENANEQWNNEINRIKKQRPFLVIGDWSYPSKCNINMIINEVMFLIFF